MSSFPVTTCPTNDGLERLGWNIFLERRLGWELKRFEEAETREDEIDGLAGMFSVREAIVEKNSGATYETLIMKVDEILGYRMSFFGDRILEATTNYYY